MVLQRFRQTIALDAKTLSAREGVSKFQRVSCGLAPSSLVRIGKAGLGNIGRISFIFSNYSTITLVDLIYL